MAKGAKSPGEEKKSSGGMAGFLIVTLLAIAGGGGFGLYLSGNLKEKEVPKKADAAKQKPEEKTNIASGAKLVELAPIIANLAEPKSAWMRIEASLIVEGSLEGVSALGGQIAEDIVAYIKTTTLAQFEGGSGFQNLREDLNERARLRGGKDVLELVIHGVVVE